MKLYIPALAALLLAACGSEAPTAPAQSGAAQAEAELPVAGPEVPMLALGDSLFTGYGLADGESYPAKLEAALRARGINARMVNAGVSGDTSMQGAQRLSFALDGQETPPDVVLVSLGGNDMLRGLSPAETRANLDAILGELRGRGITPVLLGMLAAPNMGADYAKEFNAIYPALAKKHDAVLVPFFLRPLMDRPNLVQADRIHPTEEGIAAMVEATVDAVAGAVPEEK
jgi:acyl-CoA thioesterase-1